MLSTSSVTQDYRVSQVALPCDSQGTVDFSNYPFRVSPPFAFIQCYCSSPVHLYISHEQPLTCFIENGVKYSY